jgi:LCP family protein required for cell wall assembly
VKKNETVQSNRAQPDTTELDYFQPVARKQAPQSHRYSAVNRVVANNNEPRRPARSRRAGGRKQWTRRQKWVFAGSVVVGSILILSLIAFLVLRSLMGSINIVNPSDETLPSEYNMPTDSLANPIPEEKGVVNILLLGVDNRDKVTVSVNERSDTMMILTIDEINNKIKLTSLQRDMAVFLPGAKSVEKINAANAIGGPALAMRAVNDALRLNIKNYVVVNMRGMEDIINIAGGVTINVKPAELPYVNKEIKSINRVFGSTKPSPLLANSGEQILDGRQAVTYSRIRKGDSDYKRMERQRDVLQALLSAFMKTDMTTKTNMITKGLSLITTNMSAGQLTKLGLQVLPMMDGKIEQMQIPINGYFTEYSGSVWMNLCDFNGMIPLLQQFIWGKTYPFDKVREIPGAPNSSIPMPTVHYTTAPTTTRPTTTATTTIKPTTIKPTTTATTAPTTTSATSASETTTADTTTGKTTSTKSGSGNTSETTSTVGSVTTAETTAETTVAATSSSNPGNGNKP